ncbi:MAG: peptide ABC transporter substrate-binding protein [Chloroflexota bacterium]|nr:peptide ABC transporter substrate-binding protein [Chloroflexota bacterium]
MRRSRSARVLLAASLGVSLAGCTGLPPASPTPATSSGETIVVALPLPPFVPPPFFRSTNAAVTRGFVHPELASRLVYNGLYRYDDSLAPVPDLAAEPCTIADDGLTITCTLVEATFHDGTPLTADDVVFTYELARRANRYELGERFGCLFAFGYCVGDVLESATAVDERTVQFRLTRADATFLTLVMPDVLIDSRAVVESAYAPLAERAPDLDPSEYQTASDEIAGELESGDPDCAELLPRADELLDAAGLLPLPREMFTQADATLDACLYAHETTVLLGAVAASLQASGLDAIAEAYPALSFNRAPVGTGPFRWIEVTDGTRVRLEANPDYHHGPPAAPAIEIVLTRDSAAAQQQLIDGDIHWLPILPIATELLEVLRAQPDLRIVQYPESGFLMLAYNVREGMLFADRNLRTALELCIDKPATVDAATQGTGEPVYSHVTPVSWAYHADLPRPTRDVAEARELIEASRWVEGEDGVYVRDGERLATDIFVTDRATERLAFMELTAEQARDCGFDLTVIPADQNTVLAPLFEYPHIPGGREQPFDAHVIGWAQAFDPHDPLFHSSQISSEEQPAGLNFMGYRNERVDALIDAGLATYDQRERARIYRELQEIIAEERPVLFAWAGRSHDVIDSRLGYVDEEINLGSPQWFWQLEKLTLRDED